MNTLKKLFLVVLFCSTAQLSFAQYSAKEETLLKKLSDMTCSKMEKVDIDEVSKSANPTAALGMLFLPAIEKYQDDIKKTWNLDMTREEDGRKLGEMVGMYMAGRCPKFMELVSRVMGENKAINEEVTTELKERFNMGEQSVTIAGTIQKVELGELSYVYVSTEEGEVVRLLLFKSFPGIETMAAKAGDKKKYNLSYTVLKAFNGKTGKEQEYKQLIAISAY